jgi:prepilin-type N-terminal cleavage/methylation domain-containing protein
MRNRRGFTLVEILVSLVIMLIVSGAIYKMLNSSQRLSRAQAERVSLQTNIRSGALVVPTELRELSTYVAGTDDQNDVMLITGTTDIKYRAMRGIGFVCQAPTNTEIRIARSALAGSWPGYSGYRDPTATRDGIYVFIDGDESVGGVDSWLNLSVTGVNATSTCGAASAIALTVPNTPALTAALTAPPLRTPIRIYEVMQLQLYPNGGKSWLGAKSVNTGEAYQPVLGPLTDAEGLGFEYLDAAGAVTADRKSVKSIRVTVRGITEQAINGGSGSSGAMSSVQDTLVSQVVLRNAFRP